MSSEGILRNADATECHVKTFGYSADGFNLLVRMGDCKGNQTVYTYKPGTNLLTKKLIYDKTAPKKKTPIQKRAFYSYNDDAVCIKTIEDDGFAEEESKIVDWHNAERHIKEIKPKEILPGLGLPEVIREKALNLKTKREILIKKLVNVYDDQSNLLSCDTYDANEQHAFTETSTYNSLGQVISRTNVVGREICYSYDGIGNQISISIPREDKFTTTTYNFRNQPTESAEVIAEGHFTTTSMYDSLGRKIGSTDRFGNSTQYEYDAFHRLTKLIHPEVYDENNEVIQPTFQYAYDLFGNVVTTQDPKGFITEKSYNLRGSPTKISYPDGSFELFKYDTEGSLHRSLTRDRIITVYEYDCLGRAIYEESSTASETGVASFLISKSRHYNGFRCVYERNDIHEKHYLYDPAGRLSSVREQQVKRPADDPNNRQTDIIYDSLGRIHQKKIWFDAGFEDYSVECFNYDLSGNILEKRIENARGAVLLKKCFSYGSQGLCAEEYTSENGIKTLLTQTSCNSEGEPISCTDALNQETKIIIDKHYHNTLGQQVLKKTLINPIGVRTEIEFDALSRACCVSKKDPLGICLSSQRTLYDALGNKSCEMHDQIVEGEILNTQKTKWIYRPMGHLEEEIRVADSTLEQRTYYGYNDLGKMISKTIQGSDISINYTYNKDGRLHKIAEENNKKELRVSNTYSHDYRGNILSAHSLYGKSI